MGSNRVGSKVVPFAKVRLRNTDFLLLMHRKHIIHSLMEFDVTMPRKHIRDHKAETGESLSFTAFIIGCLAKAVDEDKQMHAYRKGMKQLVVFDEVDVTTLVEHEVDGTKIATPYILRAANKKTLSELHHELRQSQQQKAREFRSVPWYEALFFSLPGFVRVFFLGALGRSPYLRKKLEGTVVVTAVGMFGEGGGWGIPMTTYTLSVTLGGIAEKPGIVDGRIEAREYLYLTISADHDIIDGAPLARFASRLKELIEGSYGLSDRAAVP